MIEKLECFHPLVIEGMGGYDPRDPAFVASQIIRQLANRWSTQPPSKPLLLITQGDPYEERGISAITRLVADELDISMTKRNIAGSVNAKCALGKNTRKQATR